MKKNLKLFWHLYLLIMIMIGGLLGIYLIEKKDGVFDVTLAKAVVFGTLGGGLISIILSKFSKKSKTSIPPFDERNLLLMKRYLMIVLYLVLFGSGLVLVILYGMGVYTIETGMLIVYMMALYILILIGALIVNRL